MKLPIKRSFYGHVFLATLLSVALFLAASRWVVRYGTDDFLLNYFNETLAHHTARELDAQTPQLNPQALENHLAKSIDDLQPGEMRVLWLPDDGAQSVDASWHAVVTEPGLSWQSLGHQSDAHPFAFVYVNVNGLVWSVLKTQHAGRTVYVAVQRAALMRSFEEILNVRNDMTYRMAPILLIFVIFFTLFTSYNAVAPVLKLQKSFAKIHIRSSNEHISLSSNYREFATFIDYFNALIDRLRVSYQQAARFSSDASHELRTPLTIIRGHIDRLIHQTPDGSVMQRNLALVGEEVERLISITNKLLWLSQADAGHMKLDKKVVKFNDVVGQMVDDLRIFNAHLHFSTELRGHIEVVCDHELLLQLLGNLFNNAIKYNHPQGRVQFVASVRDDQLHFSISNTTPLSIEGLDDRVFERFYRYCEGPDQHLIKKTGSGLGLSLCREILHAHHGSIHLSTPEGLVRFDVTLPLA